MDEVGNLRDLVRDLVARDAVTVPPFPGVAMRLRQLVDSGKYGAAELARLVSEDQAITAAVLRAANSALKRGLTPITTLNEAVGRLGSEELSRVALGTSLGSFSSADGPLVELRRLSWRQALAGALVCRALAPARGLTAEEGFVTGLLHDFGRLVAVSAIESLLTNRPADWDRSEDDWMTFIDEFHVEIGLIVAERWNLSDLMRAVIARHHGEPKDGPFEAAVDLAATSDSVVAVLEKMPFVLARDLLAVPRIRGQSEADLLMRTLPFVPGFLLSIESFAPATKGLAASRVVKHLPLLGGTMTPVAFIAYWLRQSGEVGLKVSAAGPDGLVATCKEKLRENNLVWLKIKATRTPLELCARVLSSVPDGGRGFRCEFRFYALSAESRQIWDGVCAQPPAP